VEQDTSYGSKFASEDVQSTNATFRFEKDLKSNLLLTNQFKFSRNEREISAVSPTSYNTTVPVPPATNPNYLLVARNFTANDRYTENFSNLTTLRSDFSTGFVQHVLSAGLEATSESSRGISYTGGAIGGVDLERPSHSLEPTLDPAKSGARTISELDTVSLNVFETAKFTEQWQLTGGVRVEYYELDYQSRAATGVDTQVKTDDVLADWKLGVVFKPRENGSVYVSYGYSEQNPGTNLNLSASETGTGADNVNSDPQEATNVEVGTKWNWFDNKLGTTFALYRTKQKNIGVATDAITGEIVQTGEQTVQGAEFSVTGQITDNWAVFGGIGYADSENDNPTSTAADSAELQYTPELSGSLWTSYKFDFGLTVGGGVRYQDETTRSLTAVTNGSIAGTDAYWVFDALASYEVNKNVTVRFNVNNVFDEQYIRSVNNNGGRYNPGSPRSYVVSADWKF
jgi:catecholate siderophore receptor